MENRFSPAGGEFLLAPATADSVFTPEDFSPESRLVGDTAGDFLRAEVLPHVERIEGGDHDLMHSLMRKAGELGLLGADVPEVYGGLGLDVPTSALIAEKLNYQQSFALTHEAHTVIATLPLLYFGTPAQKAKYLPKLASGEWVGSFALSEADSGSDALALRTRATRSEDGTHWRLNGMKMWITNTAFARLFTVFARAVDPESGEEKITAFLVERDFPGVSFGSEERKLGMKGTSTRRVILEDAHVPAENAMPLGTGTYAAFCALNLGRFKLEAGAVGGLKEVLAVCAAYAKQRKTFGKPIGSYGLVRHKLAEMAARTYALESMVYRLAGDLERAFAPIAADAPDASARYHRAAEEYAVECNVVKVIGSEAYSELTDEAIQMHGGYGYTEQFPVARAWRDQRLLRIGEGANEIVRVAIVNLLLRRDRAGRLPVLSADVRPPASGGDLDRAAGAARLLAVRLLRLAATRLGPAALLEAQEAAAGVADVVCAAYALESVALRTAKLVASGGGDARAQAATLLASVAALGHAATAARSARYALSCLDAGRPSEITELVERLDGAPGGNPMHLRRDLAGLVLERGGWVL